jgi:predicted membrane chloride channel (bestrophin family)
VPQWRAPTKAEPKERTHEARFVRSQRALQITAVPSPKPGAASSMILYPHAFSGIPLLLTFAGSALPRAFIPALISGIIAAVAQAYDRHDREGPPGSHNATVASGVLGFDAESLFQQTSYPYQVFATAVAFALVFRTNVAYNRYWEGITHLKTFSAKWGDVGAFALSFDRHANPGLSQELRARAEETRELYASMLVHRCSLLHALAIAHLRRECGLRPMEKAGVSESAMLIEADEAGRLGDHTSSRLALLCKCMNCLRACKHSKSRYDAYLTDHPLAVIGGRTSAETDQLDKLDSEARVMSAYAQLLATLNARRAAGGLWVDPPTVSRLHQELSAGMEGFQQACKLEDTPFPFPYAQLIAFLLFVFSLTYPFVAVGVGSEQEADLWIGPALSFFVVLTYFGFHEVARELEDPFLHPPNELPLVSLQRAFNTRLLSTWEACKRLYDETIPSTHDGVGLVGLASSGAEDLLSDWLVRPEAKRVSAVMPRSEFELEGGGEPEGDASRSRLLRGHSRRAIKASFKSGSKLRSCVSSQPLSMQLVSVG